MSTGVTLKSVDQRPEFSQSCKQLRNFFLLFNLKSSKERYLKSNVDSIPSQFLCQFLRLLISLPYVKLSILKMARKKNVGEQMSLQFASPPLYFFRQIFFVFPRVKEQSNTTAHCMDI